MTHALFFSSPKRPPPEPIRALSDELLGDQRGSPLGEAVGLAISLALSFAAAGIGALLTNQSLGTWYPGLTKPSWNPPDWVFGPVWTLLYIMMAVAAWLVWRSRDSRPVALPLGLYAVQLTLNVLWSGIFFGLQMPGAAFIEVVVLWLTILATILAFWRVERVAAGLLVPYLAWVSFASALNFAIWYLNG